MDRQAVRVTGIVAVAGAGALAGLRPEADASGVLVAAVCIALLGLGSYLLANVFLSATAAAVMTAVASVLLGRHLGASGMGTLVILTALAALSGFMGSYDPRSGDVVPTDGILAVATLVLVSLAMGVLAPVPRPGPAFHQTTVILLLYLMTPPFEVAAALGVLARGRRVGDFLRSRYGARPNLSRIIGRGVLAGVGLLLLASISIMVEASAFGTKVVPNNPFVYSPHLASSAPLWGIAALIGAVVVLAPLAEELLFRGLLFGGLAAAVGVWPAAFLSALIFGAAHLDLSLMLGLGLAGLALNGLYWRYRSLWVSTAAHATLNAVSVMLALLVH